MSFIPDRLRSTHRKVVLLVAASLLAVAGCTSDDALTSAENRAAAEPDTRGADVRTAATEEPTSDEMTPLLVSSLGDPVPVLGADDRYHLVYELEVLNAAPRDATIQSIETLDADSDVALATIDADEIVARTVLAGSAPATPTPVESIPAGRTISILMDDTFAARGDVPDAVRHRIRATFAAPAADQAPYAAAIYPDEVTSVTGEVRTSAGEPLRIGSPLQGDGWIAVNACCELTQHRGAMLPMAGRLHATERYAIDWIQIEPDRVEQTLAEGLLPSFDGDPTRNESYLAYGQPLLAVADGTVVDVVDGLDDATPQELPAHLALDELGGNLVILDLGDGYYAFYAHVQRGSVPVKVGDRVRRGDVVGRLGNSGNSTEAHLHFHISRGPTPLAATNWPFVIAEFDVVGSLTETGLVPDPTPGPRKDQLILVRNVTSFPMVVDG